MDSGGPTAGGPERTPPTTLTPSRIPGCSNCSASRSLGRSSEISRSFPMFLKCWQKLFHRKSQPIRGRAGHRRQATSRPTVEILETRTLPTVSFGGGGNFYTGGYNTTSLATGDFNHDGAADLATVNANTSTLGVL